MNTSVVVPTYNHSRYLGVCIESALRQTMRPHEVIVVDDGSTDETRGVLASFGTEIVTVCQPNKGTYAALNEGIRHATGDWVAIHNDDDAWAPTKLARQAELVSRHPSVGVVHTGAAYIDVDGQAYTPRPGESTMEHRATGEQPEDLSLAFLHSNPVAISSAMVGRHVFDRVGLFDERFLGCGDWQFCLRAALEYPFARVEEALTLVRRHPASSGIDSSRLRADWRSRDGALLNREALLPAAKIVFARAVAGQTPRAKTALALASLGTYLQRSDDRDLAAQVFSMALRLEPLRLKTLARYVYALRLKRVQR